ncbi:MAG: hypothetical protein ACI8XO_003952 [Verrucomicrobiales bacterium]|jgi:hypothetical protein
MSEEDNKPKPPAKPTTKTSTVPLKKETVRITLRAKPGAGTEGAPAPPKPPAPRPPAPPSAAGAPRPPAPPRPAGGGPPPPAPTIPLSPARPAGAPAPPPAGAKTVPLTQAPTPSGPAVGAQTARLQSTPPNAPGTRPLPKATVKLAPTQPIASAPTASISSAPIKGGVASQVLADDEAEEEGGITPFAAIALVLAVAVLAIELLTSQRIFMQDKLGEPSFAVPIESNRYHKSNAAGDLTPNFKAPPLPEYSPKSIQSPDIGAND